MRWQQQPHQRQHFTDNDLIGGRGGGAPRGRGGPRGGGRGGYVLLATPLITSKTLTDIMTLVLPVVVVVPAVAPRVVPLARRSSLSLTVTRASSSLVVVRRISSLLSTLSLANPSMARRESLSRTPLRRRVVLPPRLSTAYVFQGFQLVASDKD